MPRPVFPLPPRRLLLSSLLLASGVHAIEDARHAHDDSHAPLQVQLVLSGDYYRDNRDGAGDALVREAGLRGGMHDEAHDHGRESGFNLGESELALSATVGRHADAKFALALSGEGDTEIEEAWLQTRRLPAGFTLRAGRFQSGIGFHNHRHPHAWDFVDQNLAYAALLGEHGLVDTGLQLTWQAPAHLPLRLGAEVLRGEDQERFGTRIEARAAADVLGPGPWPAEKSGPRLVTAFATLAPDLGDAQALQLGLSYARARQLQQVLDADGTPLSGDEYGLDGHQRLYGSGLVYRYAAAGEHGHGEFTLAAEYLFLETAMRVTATGAAAPLPRGTPVNGKQDGYYLHAVYGMAPRWQLGLRYDTAGAVNELAQAGMATDLKASSRYTAALSFTPNTLLRLRLQVARGRLRDETGDAIALHQLLLSCTLNLGVHDDDHHHF